MTASSISGSPGGELGIRGRLTALDAKTGKILWRAYTLLGLGETGSDSSVTASGLLLRGEPEIYK